MLNNRLFHTRHSQRSLSNHAEYQYQKKEHDNNHRLRRKNITATTTSMNDSSLKSGDTFVVIITALWKRLDLLNSPLGYMIIAATFMLVALLAVIYAILTVALNRRNARDKYKEVQVVVVDNGTEFNEFGQPRRYRRLNPNNQSQHTYATARYVRTPGNQIMSNELRSQTSKNSLNSLQRHYIDQYGDGRRMSESEMERLYRSISPFKRYPLGAPSITSEDSSTMCRIINGENSDRRIKERLRRPPLEAPPPPPPPRIPPPPTPSHCKFFSLKY